MARIKNCKGKKFNQYIQTVTNTNVFEYKAGLADPELKNKMLELGKKKEKHWHNRFRRHNNWHDLDVRRIKESSLQSDIKKKKSSKVLLFL